MRLDCKSILIVLLVFLISNLRSQCRASALASQPQRQIGPQSGKNSSSIERIAAILSAKPRPSSLTATTTTTTTTALNQQHPTGEKKAGQTTARLRAEASNLDAKVASSPSNATNSSRASKSTTTTAKNQGKRQAEYIDPNRPSRRNEDPWFLDQAPLPLQPYRFVYNVKDKNGLTEQYRQETGDGKFLTGSYGYVLPDGIFRHVDYVADDRGFRAFIRTTEPGTANQNPADVVINSNPVPIAGYVPPPTTISSTIGSQASPLLDAPTPFQRLPPSQSWSADSPRSAWNDSSLAFASERLKQSNLDEFGTLPRRAPGSIVGTPLRNFSTLAYPFPPPASPTLDPPLGSRYQNTNNNNNNNNNNDNDTFTGGHFQSLARFGDLHRFKPLSGSTGSAFGNNLTAANDQFLTHLGADGRYERERDTISNASLSGASLESYRQRADRERAGLFLPSLSAAYQRPGLLLPNRVGPDILLYDRPFGVLQTPGEASNKLSYDYNHVLGRDTASLLAEERAKDLTQLDRLKLLSRTVVVPDLYANELATLNPIGGSLAVNQQPLPPVTGGGSLGAVDMGAGTKTTSSSHFEHHQEQKSSTSQTLDNSGKTSLTREHKSGSETGSHHESTGSSRTTLDGPPLTPPPQPQFNNNGNSQQRWATKGGQQQQQPMARLLAPYADELRFGRKDATKGGQEAAQQLLYDNQQQTSSPPPPPDEPRPPTEPSQPMGETGSTKQVSASQRTTPADEIELNQATTSKSAPLSTRSTPEHPHHQVRSIRMPEDYRKSMWLNDFRSMQNALGLPQPPRLQRSSPIEDEHKPGNSVEHLMAARMNRVDALLGGNIQTGSGNTLTASPQQASVQRSVAVRANKPSPDESVRFQLPEISSRPTRANLSSEEAPSASKQTETNEIEDDPPRRRTISGPLLKQQQVGIGSQRANESSLFEAQRLNNSRARLRADKVSELEKFQQRLRTQQLLLEHLKNNSTNNGTLQKAQPKVAPLLPRVNEANSHVKYDEPHENELVHLSGHLGAKDDEHSRPRRQDDSDSSLANRVVSNTRKEAPAVARSNIAQGMSTTTRAPSTGSEFARQLNQWPSISAGTERQRNNTSGENVEANPTSGLPALKAHKMDSAKQSNGLAAFEVPVNGQRAEPASSTNNGTRHSSPNTINMDFINTVTALSVDQLNPFAISSVNPAVQRSSGASSERLSPHRLAMPLSSNQQQQQQSLQQVQCCSEQHGGGGASLLATAPARYFNSPELLAALNHHERHDTGQRMRSLLGIGQTEHANHRASGNGGGPSGTNAPYMMQPQEQATGGRSLENILGAKFVVSPASAPNSLMSEAANSQHKSVVPTPRPPGELAVRHSRSSHSRTVGAMERDGFEIRDRTVQADNHRFYEVVSGLSQPSETSSSFQAFRDSQLSIPARS